jgi:hypothetical protein
MQLDWARLVPRVGSQHTKTSRRWTAKPGTWDKLHAGCLFPRNTWWGIPELEPETWVPRRLVPFHETGLLQAAAEAGADFAVHYFVDDYRFERVWNQPARSLERLARATGTLTPDFSLYREMPLAMQLWQTYRSRWMGAYWQANGIPVIPTASWSTEESFAFCFDGIPPGNVAISTVGIRDEDDRRLFRAGVARLVATVRPATLLCYGGAGDLLAGMETPHLVEYPTHYEERGWRGRQRSHTSQEAQNGR